MTTPHSALDDAARASHPQQRASRSALVALAIACSQTVAGLPLMAHGSSAGPAIAGAAMHPLLRPALLLSTLAVFWIARSLLVDAGAALRRRAADVNTLAAIGSGTAFLYSAAATLSPARFAAEARLPEVHFEAASFILAFLLLGRAIEGRALGALSTRGPVQRLPDRVATYLAAGIAVIATTSALAWVALGPEPRFAHATAAFVSVVVASCPCALALTTSTALAAAVGRAARLGILVRSGDALERAALVDTVAIDITGTLSDGEPQVVELVVLADADPDEVLRMAAAVERGSEHPVGRAILAEAAERGIDVPQVRGHVTSAGGGARAEVLGRDVRVGAMTWLAGDGVSTEGTRPEAAFGIAVDGVLRAYGLVADRLRDDASEAVARLRALGVRVAVLTGDRQDVARAVAAELGIDEIEAELSPDGKLAALERLERAGRRVAMCGHGSGDAEPMARALVGITVGAPPDDELDVGDITLVDGDMARLPDALQLARRSRRVIRQNVAWALAYNVALVPVAALVPWFGARMPAGLVAAAMALSCISVVLSSRRLRRFEPRASISREPPG